MPKSVAISFTKKRSEESNHPKKWKQRKETTFPHKPGSSITHCASTRYRYSVFLSHFFIFIEKFSNYGPKPAIKILFFYYVFYKKRHNMESTRKMEYAKELIKAGLKRELILKITSISEHEYSLIQRQLALV